MTITPLKIFLFGLFLGFVAGAGVITLRAMHLGLLPLS